MARRRLLAILGALGLVAGLLTSGVAAQADNSMSEAAFNALVSGYATVANNGQTFCYAQPSSSTTCPTLTQTSTTQNNFAICIESSTANPASQYCNITQANGAGHNVAIIIQLVRQNGGAVQSGTQDGSISQDTGTGSNLAATVQMFTQRFGNRNEDPSQTDSQASSTFQTSGSGRNYKLLKQSSRQDAQSALGGTQNSSEDGTINQTSSGVSKAVAFQDQHQGLTGGGPQSQMIDPRCCSNQTGNPNNVFQITQRADQRADSMAANQDSLTEGTCDSTGHCTIDQTASTNAGSQHNHLVCNPGFCSTGIVCTAAACTPCTPGEGGCLPPNPGAPVASLGSHGMVAVRGSSVALSRSASRYAGVARSVPSVALLT